MALTATLLSVCGAVALAHNGPAVPALNWVSCGEDFPGVECATAIVPLDYDHPAGATTEIALTRVPAGDPANKIGSLFVNPGGPGGSGADLVLFGFGDFLNAVLQGRFDIIGFDPRGVAASDPIQCFDTNDQLDAFFINTPIFPWERRQERPFFEDYRGYTRQCLSRGQAIRAHMSTADVVRDLDLLRRAVGDRRLTYLGFSYGSFIGNTYANMFPQRVRALVIDGVLDPRLWVTGAQIISDRTASEKVLEEFLRLCDAAGDDCALGGPDGPASRFFALLNSVKAQPIVFPSGFVFTYDQLITQVLGGLYAPEVWGGPDGLAAFLDFLTFAAAGDANAARDAARVRDALEARLRPPSANRAPYNNGLDAFYGNYCSDAEFPSSFAAFRGIGTFASQDSLFGPLWWWQNAGCADWPTSPDRYIGPWSTTTSAPVLVVGNYFDNATDYAGAVASSKLLRNSRLLSYAGWGHTAFGRNDCVTEYVAGYLLAGELPPRGTVCAANPNPFVPTPALRRAGPVAPLIGLPPSRPGR
jgi:pimeloyl-ACP methyl ester carboxylesterase